MRTIKDVVPVPMTAEPDATRFTVTGEVAIVVNSPAAASVGEYLAKLLRQATGYPVPVRSGGAVTAHPVGGIALLLGSATTGLGAEGYILEVAWDRVTLRADEPAGLFRGVQTLRQLLPPSVESRGIASAGAVGEALTIPGGRVVDRPRFAYRGVMLDVARHFFPVADIKRVIELVALYKINYLHLHLTDDQGWRIAIDAWPRLASFGGGSEVGGGPGGYYTKDDFREIVAYARQHHITVVPEFDMPGHTNAALASYPELACDGWAPQRYTGIEVGFSSLCADKDITYRFLDDVYGELAALTPGPYLHIGGDEALSLSKEDYATVVARAQEIVNRHGKVAIGWHEVAAAALAPSTVLQFWGPTPHAPELVSAAANGTQVIMSPSNRVYLDMKYDEATPLGQSWAGHIALADAYDWDPADYLPGLPPTAVLGVESPLWTETIRTLSDIEFMAFPRLAAVAEVGWSAAPARCLDCFRRRLAAQAKRWEALNVSFYRAPEVPWVDTA